jgi:hypothetical protein
MSGPNPGGRSMAQRRKYGLVSHRVPMCSYKWKRINEMLRDPEAFAAVSGSFVR